MEFLLAGGVLTIIGISLLVLLVLSAVLLFLLRGWIKVARADEALVISGRAQRSPDGDSPVTVIVNGKALVNPITQRHETISLRSRQVTLNPEAQSLDGVTLTVEGVALVKIGSSPDLVRRAAERFASQDKAIEQFTTEQLEGALRGVVAKLSVVELMRERKKFSDEIAESISTELSEQGLILDSFQIKGITDAVGYISSLGAPEIEAKRQAAEIARTDAERAIRKQQILNEEANLVEQTNLDTNTASSKSEVGQANAQAEQSEALAQAQAQQAVLQQRAENRQAELDADIKRVADARLYESQRGADAEAYEKIKAAQALAEIAAEEARATQLRAEADADAVRLAGEARAAAIRAEAEALALHQDALLAQRALETLPQIMAEFSRGYERVGSITVVGGAEGANAGSQTANESSIALRSVFESVRATTGLDLASIIQGRVVGEAVGSGISDARENNRGDVAESVQNAFDSFAERNRAQHQPTEDIEPADEEQPGQ